MIIFTLAESFTGFLISMAMFGTGMSGFGGFKHVLSAQIFGVQNLQSFIAIDQLITCPGAFIFPNLLIWISITLEDLSLIYKIATVAAIIR